jgi:hypothetical protein
MPPITEICFVEEAPGRAREGGTESVVRSHAARIRYRRRRDADVRAFKKTREETEDLIVQEKTTLAGDKPVRASSIQPSLLYQDNCGWYSSHYVRGQFRRNILISHSDPLHVPLCHRTCIDAPPHLCAILSAGIARSEQPCPVPPPVNLDAQSRPSRAIQDREHSPRPGAR